MKRFWTNALPARENGAYLIRLDGRPVKTPGGAPLAVPYEALAKGIAGEWSMAAADFTPDDLPLTQLACTALERIPPHRREIVSRLAAYGLNDLLCYRAPETEPLAARQHEEWDPWLRWFDATHEIGLITTIGLMPVRQLPWTGEKLETLLAARSDYALAALGLLIPALGSFVLALAAAEGALSAAAACEIAALDERFQEERWGEDPQELARRARIRAEAEAATRFLALTRS